jgi:hypothetical protein
MTWHRVFAPFTYMIELAIRQMSQKVPNSSLLNTMSIYLEGLCSCVALLVELVLVSKQPILHTQEWLSHAYAYLCMCVCVCVCSERKL